MKKKFILILVILFCHTYFRMAAFADEASGTIKKFIRLYEKGDIQSSLKYISELDYKFVEDTYKTEESTTPVKPAEILSGILSEMWGREYSQEIKQKYLKEKILSLNQDNKNISEDLKEAQAEDVDDLKTYLEINKKLAVLLQKDLNAKAADTAEVIKSKVQDEWAVIVTRKMTRYPPEEEKNISQTIENILNLRNAQEEAKKNIFWKKGTLYMPVIHYLHKDSDNSWKVVLLSLIDFPGENFLDIINEYRVPIYDDFIIGNE